MQKSTKEATGAEKKFFCFFTAQLSLSFSGEKGSGVQNDLFISPPFFFPHNFFPMRCPWPLTFVESETRRRVFFLPIFVYSCFCVLTASGRAAALNFDSVELNWTFPDWIEFFSEWIELFPSLAYSKRIQSNNQEANKGRKVKNKTKERKERVFDKYLKQKGKNSGERDRCGGD